MKKLTLITVIVLACFVVTPFVNADSGLIKKYSDNMILSKIVDDMDDSVTYHLVVFPHERKGAISLMRDSGKQAVEMAIATESSQDYDTSGRHIWSIEPLFRFDKEKAFKVRFTSSAYEYHYSFSDNPYGLINKMKSSNKLLLKLGVYRDPGHVFKFDLTGFTAAYEQFMKLK